MTEGTSEVNTASNSKKITEQSCVGKQKRKRLSNGTILDTNLKPSNIWSCTLPDARSSL